MEDKHKIVESPQAKACHVMIHAEKCLESHVVKQLCFGFIRRLLRMIGESISPRDFVSVIVKMLGIDNFHQIQIYTCDSNGDPDASTVKTRYICTALRFVM